ncbi:hypothetical protein RJ640_013480 [Escallonia rubra]|uniref:WAT1-related protein n=1 Tax=Escallonia rubra TaxID=112253 RepID=A0AA88R845_9ASTE|nr:hypothetical protein RJ640_013480 [Escallonia rubra]
MKTTCTGYAAMVLVQFAYGGSNILMKIALEKGLDQLVFVVYRHLIAMLLLGPLAYVVERMEKVTVKSARGQAKILGTLTCICGSLVFTFWKGGYLFKRFVDRPLINIYETRASLAAGKENWVKGSVLILTSYVAWSLWLILQAVVYKIYPARLSMNALICFFASLQSSLLALFLGRDPTIWRLGWNVQLLTIIYCGVVISALVYYLQTWCISNQGPVFAAMFSPLLLVFVGIFSTVAFAEQIHLGSLIGAFLIVVGLYCVIWGKRTDGTGSSGPCENGGADNHSNNNRMVKIPVNDDHLHGESSHI